MSDFLKSFPILKQLGDALSDYPLVTAGVVLILAFFLPYTGLENANSLQDVLVAFAFFVYGGGSVWDWIDKYKNPTK